MMVTINSMKKMQQPDLLLDQARHHRSNTNNLNKAPQKSSSHHRSNNSNRKFHQASEDSTYSFLSTSSALTTDETSSPSPEGAVVIECSDEKTRWSQKIPSVSSYNDSSPRVWIRSKTCPTFTDSPTHQFHFCGISTKRLIVLVIILVVILALIVSILAYVLSQKSHPKSSQNTVRIPSKEHVDNNLEFKSINRATGENDGEDTTSELLYDYDEPSSEHRQNSESDTGDNLGLKHSEDYKKEVSRLSWNMLNSNQERKEGGLFSTAEQKEQHNHQDLLSISSSMDEQVVLPSKMIFTASSSNGESSGSLSNAGGESNKNKKRSCCRTQKYSQIIKRDGCEPITITNKMCFGQCVSVWVPGLFASFPVCKPSRSSWKTVNLTCGKNRRRVRIEKVKRCSCMEIDPTTQSSQSPSVKR